MHSMPNKAKKKPVLHRMGAFGVRHSHGRNVATGGSQPWTCRDCGYFNFATRSSCRKSCRHGCATAVQQKAKASGPDKGKGKSRSQHAHDSPMGRSFVDVVANGSNTAKGGSAADQKGDAAKSDATHARAPTRGSCARGAAGAQAPPRAAHLGRRRSSILWRAHLP